MQRIKGLKVKKGDKVKILTGKDQGREGEVIGVSPARGKVLVSGINMVKHFGKKTPQDEGGITEREAPVPVSNMAVLCPKCKKASRLSRERVCRNCGAKIDGPPARKSAKKKK